MTPVNKDSVEDRAEAVSLAIKLYQKVGAPAGQLLVTAEAIRQYLAGEMVVPLTTDDGEELFPINRSSRQFDNAKDVVSVCDRLVCKTSSAVMENAVAEFVFASGNTGSNLPDQGLTGSGDIVSHRNSSSVDGLDNPTMDEAGGSGNAATSRVEVMQGQCGEKGFVDLGVPLDQRMAEAEMLAPNNSQNKENSNHSHLFYGVDCVQMDWTLDGTSVLRVSGDFGQKYTTGFWVHMAGEPGAYVRFSFLGSVKGQMLFSAVQWRLVTDQQLSPPSPLLKLRGPFLKGSPDVF